MLSFVFKWLLLALEESKIEIVPLCEALAKTVRQETFDLVEEQVVPHKQ